MSGCCYYSCLLRKALSLPGTFSLVQRCWQLAANVCVCMGVRLDIWTYWSHWSALDVLLHMCVLCIVYIGACVCALQSCYQRVIDWQLGSSVARGSLLWEAVGSDSQALTRDSDEPDCPPSVRVCVWMGCVYVANSVWQGVVGGWCSTAIIWAQGWRVMEEELVEEGREGGRPAGVFAWTLVKFCQYVCVQLPWPLFWKWQTSSFVFSAYVFLFILPLWSLKGVNRCVYADMPLIVCLADRLGPF